MRVRDSSKLVQPTKKQELDQIDRIRHLRSIGTPDIQIRDQLQLSEAAFWRRVKKMKAHDRAIMLAKFSDDIASEVRIFEIRLMRDIMACESVISNQNADSQARLDAIRLKTDLGILMIKMYKEGPRILNANRISALEQKEQQQLGLGYIRQADIHSTTEGSDSNTN